MRIAHIAATFPPYAGGTGHVCLYQARQLAFQGHDVRVFTATLSGQPPSVETVDGVTVRRLQRFAGSGNAPILPSLLTTLRGYDIVHLHAPFAIGAELTAIACQATETPLVVTYHNDLVPTSTARGAAFALATRSLRLVLAQRVEKVLFVSQGHAVTCDMRDIYHRQPDKCMVLPNGIDLKRFCRADDRIDTRSRLGIGKNKALVGFVGGLDRAHHYKGLDVLLDALATKHLEGVDLLVVGDGDLRHRLEAQAEGLGIHANVHFIGAANHDQLPALYRACDVVALPSVVPEAFPLVIVEALACGIPIVASRCAGITTIIDHGSTGLLVAPGDANALAAAIRLVLDNDELRAKLSECGYRTVAIPHGWERIGQELEAIYQTILERRAQPIRLSRSRRYRRHEVGQ